MYSPGALLSTPVEFLKGVGPKRSALLQKELQIETFYDLLQHFPYRYLDGRRVGQIGSIEPGQEWVQLSGKLSVVKEEGAKFKKRLSAFLTDRTGKIELIWFQGTAWLKNNLEPGREYSVFGKISYFNGQPNIVHPEIEAYNPDSATATLQPVYPTTEKLRSQGLSNRSFARLLQDLCQRLAPADLPELLPESLLRQHQLPGRFSAFKQIHFPEAESEMLLAVKRFKWEELLLAQLKFARLKVSHQQQAGFPFPNVGGYFNEFYGEHLPFPLTAAQKRVVREIREDTRAGHQMNRLLQGDVGSGKTIVAVLAMLLALDNGYQACLLAPTEILAQQHYTGISALLEQMDIPVAYLSGTVKGKQRKQVLEGIAGGAYPIVIGTHALLEHNVTFHHLGLAVVDEQHRFGVSQRARLWQKNSQPPHILVMTATPIPRTLALSVYGDLDVSVIDELPPGRKPIHTLHRTEQYRPRVMQFIKEEIAKGRQIYIVYPLIEESEKLDYESLLAGIEQVKAWFPEPVYRVAMVHGRQPLDERQRNMERFVAGQAHILVATTVIEVGVNVPNASVMVIESAERFGLSQLHQLRGRVGRGSEKSYCILLTGHGLSKETRQRMDVMVSTNDGFKIAEEDLKMRGPGDMYGTRQSGALAFKLADIVNDVDLIEASREAARAIVAADPGLELPEHRGLKNALIGQAAQKGMAWNKIS